MEGIPIAVRQARITHAQQHYVPRKPVGGRTVCGEDGDDRDVGDDARGWWSG